jgi:prenyltransferase beta subunit
MFRHGNGVQGRVNKTVDSCYSFWVGGALTQLSPDYFTDGVNQQAIKEFILTKCACAFEECIGFSKQPGDYPDILHSFYALCWLSMNGFALKDKPAVLSDSAVDNTDTAQENNGMEFCREVSTFGVGNERKLRTIDTRIVICADKLPPSLRPAHTTSNH